MNNAMAVHLRAFQVNFLMKNSHASNGGLVVRVLRSSNLSCLTTTYQCQWHSCPLAGPASSSSQPAWSPRPEGDVQTASMGAQMTTVGGQPPCRGWGFELPSLATPSAVRSQTSPAWSYQHSTRKGKKKRAIFFEAHSPVWDLDSSFLALCFRGTKFVMTSGGMAQSQHSLALWVCYWSCIQTKVLENMAHLQTWPSMLKTFPVLQVKKLEETRVYGANLGDIGQVWDQWEALHRSLWDVRLKQDVHFSMRVLHASLHW